MKRAVISTLLMLTFCASTFAQDQKYLNEGTTFGKSIAPTQPGQVVNPANVNSSAWSGNTSSTTTVPSGLGGFSKPITSASTFDSAKTMGLVGLGNQAMDKCAVYTPGSGDAARDQECAAVNFLSQRCLTPSGAQAPVLNNAGGGGQSQLNSTFCADSFGKGANQFDFSNQVKSTDSIFGAVGNSQKEAGKKTGEVCTQKSIVTKPAEFEINTCIKTHGADLETCSQNLIASCQKPGGNCASGGILPTTTTVNNGAYTFTFDGSNLVLTNNITAVNRMTQADFSFEISGIERVSDFRITGITSDNWVGIRVNGLYIGTHSRHFGGFSASSDRLAIESVQQCYSGESGDYCYPYDMVRFSSSGYSWPETGSALYTNMNLDIRAYLKDGINKITMYVINGGGPGNGQIYMNAYQQCSYICTATWVNNCKNLESRSGTLLGTP